MSDLGGRRMLIGDRRSGASDGGRLEAINPATGETLGDIPRGTAADVAEAVEAARGAQSTWVALPPEDRAGHLVRFADRIQARAGELARIDMRDTGSPLRVMEKDVESAVRALRYFAGLALQTTGETVPSAPDRLIYTLLQPFGVVGRLNAFNHPLMFTVAKMAAPLVAGNTLITKPSEHTSLSTLALADDIQEVFPPGVVNVVTGLGSEVGDAMAVHPDVRRIAFVGSAETGLRIQQRAATESVKTITLELGGKNPIVVFPDADLELAVAGAVEGMNFTWQGQSCGSTSRLLVHRDIHEEFVARLADRLDSLRVGQPEDPESDVGSMVNRAQLDKAMRYIGLGVVEGARLAAGGRRVTKGELARGLFMRPTLFDEVDPAGRLAQEEIFGPVMAAMSFDDFEHAVRIANGVRHGLTAAVFTRDLGIAHRFARDVQAGYVWVNETSTHLPGTAFGGVKDSGVGREENLGEITSYLQHKSVSVLIPPVLTPATRGGAHVD